MNEKVIWDFLMSHIKNPYGVAGLMGNLYAESRLDPGLLEGKYRKFLGMTSEEYTSSVDNDTYNNFVSDNAGYGLAQWTYWSRKEAFLSFMKAMKVSISNLDMQLAFLVDEIKKYKTVYSTLQSATSIKEASDVVMERYEKCANQSEENKIRRAEFGQVYYDMFSVSQVRITTDKVNIRAGNGKNYPIIGVGMRNNTFAYVVTSDNRWNAIKFGNRVAWVSCEFSEIV